MMVVNFGEPAHPTLEEVVPFLERIFIRNRELEAHATREEALARARKLAVERAPSLLDEYALIGGSPMNDQAGAQARELEAELRTRGLDVTSYACFQYTAPSIDDAVSRARRDGMARLVGLPVYPLCGHSTNVMALSDLAESVASQKGWEPALFEISGWHAHPDFYSLHADHTREFAARVGVDLHAEDTALVYSIHGTPIKYLEGGSRYDRYVEEACVGISARLGLGRFYMGYQNHRNRPIEWTGPDVEAVIESLEAKRVIVHPVAFMHEQSETLVELDKELRTLAEARGLEFHRVPVPHDSPRLVSLLADVVQAALGEKPSGVPLRLRQCVCRPGGRTRCTNGLLLTAGVLAPGPGSRVVG